MGNWLDIIIVMTTLITGYVGLRMGLVVTLASMAGAGFGTFLAVQDQEGIVLSVSRPISFEGLGELAGFLVVPIVVFVGAVVLGLVLRRVLRCVYLGWLDGALGGALGLVLAVVIWFVLVQTFAAVPNPAMSGVVADSYIARLMDDNAPQITELLSDEMDGFPGSTLVTRAISSVIQLAE